MEYDFTLRLDGAGQTKDKSCGYAAIILDKDGQRIKTIVCGSSSGTNNFAELLPALNSLWYLHDWILKNKKAKIKIISDSEVTCKIGNWQYNLLVTNPSCILWFGLREYQESFKVDIDWQWIPRNSDDLAIEVDTLAKVERKKMS